MRWSTSLVSTTCSCWCPSLTLGTRTYVSRNVELLRHGHFFMNYLYTLLLIVEMICGRSLEFLFKVNEWVVCISSKPNYARKLRTQRGRGKRLHCGCGWGGCSFAVYVCAVCLRTRE